ncbi:MAG: diguanylate cyclase [Chloroflexales bacterium]
MHLLIVEDEAIIARDLATTIESFGHAVIGVVGSGEEALALAAAQGPDLVLPQITVSLGTSLVTDAHASVAEALAHADAALYAAKRAGRNCVVAHTPVSPPTV